MTTSTSAFRAVAARVGLIALAAAGLALTAAAQPGQHAGQYEQVDIEYGAQLFSQRCVTCHGENGDLLPQANLRNGVFRNAATDRELRQVITDGVPGTAMAANAYSESELTALVAYLRNMSTYDPSGTEIGDPARGRALFEGAGDCGSCHRVGSRGPRSAPDLTRIGSARAASQLQRKLLDPEGAMLPINRPVTAVTAAGEVVRGRRLNEDTFNVLLITEDEELVALDKTQLRDYAIGTESAMQSYAYIFSEQEIADLIAYLLTLTGLQR